MVYKKVVYAQCGCSAGLVNYHALKGVASCFIPPLLR